MFEDYYQYLSFEENPTSLAIGVFIILFAVSYTAFNKAFNKKNQAVALIIALIISVLAALKLYTERFYGYEATLAVLIYILVIALFLRIAWAFVRHLRGR